MVSKEFVNELANLGFDIIDCPYTPIRKEWEVFPIVKAIRKVEKKLDEVYQLSLDEYHE